jgi:hypothetical protein
MKKLSEQEIIRLMREEWNKKLSRFLESDDKLSTTARVNGEKEMVISPGLKVRSKEDDLLYTVADIPEDPEDSDFTLSKPSGEEFEVTDKDLESNYKRD